MGTTVSKLTDKAEGDFPEGNVPSVPILTPQIRRLDLDPRSPSANIARTPIEVLKTPIPTHTITTTDNSLISEDLSDCKEDSTLSRFDPRSPTTEFHRTPVIVEAALKLPIHNKNLDNARAPLLSATPAKPTRLSEKICRKIYSPAEIQSAKIISPKLLESSPITVKQLENKRNSIVGLLETNIDFVETDLDVVIQSKMLAKFESSTNANISVPDVEISTTPNEAIIEECNLSTTQDTSGLDSDDGTESNLNVISHAVSPKKFEMGTENLIGIMEEANKICEPTEIKNKASAEELDKKLTNLIYEDKHSEVSPKPSKPIGSHRTPLGDHNSNTRQRKCIPALKVSDKPTKPLVAFSKIPVFKEKKLKGKALVQCENTPPRMKAKHSQWSAEDSLVI